MAEPEGHPAVQFSVQQLAPDIVALQALALEPFIVHLQGADSFATVPYLAVQASGELQQLHQTLMGNTIYPGWHYVPHVTLGHYACSMPVAPILQLLHAVAQKLPPLALSVQQLHLVRYQSHGIAGSLTVEGCWDMRLQRYVPRVQALLKL